MGKTLTAKAARLAALKLAATKIGVTEHPPFSNRGPIIDAWNKDAGAPLASYWCCSFVHAIVKKATGIVLPGGASVYYLLAAAKKAGYVVPRPFRGDFACFEFSGNALHDDHIGFVERVLAIRWKNGKFTGWIQTVEGNTSSGSAGSQDNGGGVYRRRRWLWNAEAVFVRWGG